MEGKKAQLDIGAVGANCDANAYNRESEVAAADLYQSGDFPNYHYLRFELTAGQLRGEMATDEERLQKNLRDELNGAAFYTAVAAAVILMLHSENLNPAGVAGGAMPADESHCYGPPINECKAIQRAGRSILAARSVGW